MNSAFVGYAELSRSRRVLSTEASISLILHILRKPNSLIANYITALDLRILISAQQRMVGEYFMFFKVTHVVNLLLHKIKFVLFHQFNQPKVQCLSFNICYSSFEALHSRLRVLDFGLATIRPFQNNIFKDNFFTALIEFGVLIFPLF